MFSKSFILAALAVTVSANGLVRPGPNAMKRELLARQTETALPSGADTCLTALMSIYSAVPTPPPELLSYEATVSITDPCSFSIPKSLESAFSSYEDEIESFYSAHSSEIDSALSECPQYSAYATETDDISDACATASSGGSGTTGGTGTVASTSATATDAGSSASSSAASGSSSVSPNAGPRETGFAAAAVVAAGFLGVVAAL